MDNINLPVILKRVQYFLKSKNIKIVPEKTLMQSLSIVIECVETISNKNIAEEEKNKLAVRILTIIIYQSDLDRKKKSMLLKILDQEIVDTTTDVIVDVSKGKFKLNKKIGRRLFRCIGKCIQKEEEIPSDEDMEQHAHDEEVPEYITSRKSITTAV